MEIKLTLEEVNFITSKLSQAPAGLVYEVLKLLENKVIKTKEDATEVKGLVEEV